jgi:hypothetical protein
MTFLIELYWLNSLNLNDSPVKTSYQTVWMIKIIKEEKYLEVWRIIIEVIRKEEESIAG